MTNQALANFSNFKRLTMNQNEAEGTWELIGKIANLLPADIKKDDFTNALMHAMEKSMLKETNLPVEVAVLLARDCGKLGIVPDNKQAAIVCFKGTWQLMLMIGGVYAIAQNCGVSKWVTRTVYENDVFAFGIGDDGEEYMKWEMATGDRGKCIGAFSKVFMKSGLSYFEYMNRADLDRIQNSAPKSPAWRDWTDEMRRKCVAKRHAKTIPFDDGRRMQQAIDHDNVAMGFENAKDITNDVNARQSADTGDQQASIVGGEPAKSAEPAKSPTPPASDKTGAGAGAVEADIVQDGGGGQDSGQEDGDPRPQPPVPSGEGDQ